MRQIPEVLANAYIDMLIDSLKKALEENNKEAMLCHEKAREATDSLIKMQYISKANGLLEASLTVYKQLEKDGLVCDERLY